MADEEMDPKEMELYKETFKFFDKDGSGSVSSAEMETVLKSLGRNTTKEEIAKLMKEVDEDGSGEISFKEFLAVMKNINVRAALWDTFKEFDQDSSGFITRDELFAAMRKVDPDATDEDIDNMLREADKDGNNQIDFDEFVAIMK